MTDEHPMRSPPNDDPRDEVIAVDDQVIDSMDTEAHASMAEVVKTLLATTFVII